MRNDHLILARCLVPGFRERFFKRVHRVGKCLEWRGARKTEQNSAYGIISVGKARLGRAHRVAWALRHGALPDAILMHTCDNPPCVRISHLKVGTYAENAADMARKGRANGGPPPGSRNGNAKLTEAQAASIIRRYRDGASPKALGLEYGVARTHIHNIVRGSNWKHLHDQPS